MGNTPQTQQPPAQPGTALTMFDRQYNNLLAIMKQQTVMERIAQVLPQGINGARFWNTALTEIRRNPNLVTCNPLSVAGSIIQAAQVGLEIDRNLGQCWLIPYKKECQLQYGWRGLVQLAWRTGFVKKLRSDVVHDGDHFDYEYGTSAHLRHRPDSRSRQNPIIYAYAEVLYANGGTDFEVLDSEEIEELRARSQSPDSPAWVKDYEEMARSKPLRRLIKRMPVSTENPAMSALARAAYLGELTDAEVEQNNAAVIELEPEEAPTTGTTQDFRAAQATQDKVTNLADLHSKPQQNGSEQRGQGRGVPIPSRAPETRNGTVSSPTPAPGNSVANDPEWPTEEEVPPPRGAQRTEGTPLPGWSDAPTRHSRARRYE